MSSSHADIDLRAVALEVTSEDLVVDLTDGRRLLVPLSWFPRLSNATPAQRRNWRFIGEGMGFHWPDVDEDLSVAGLLGGCPAPGGVTGPRDRRSV
jgi:Protein of unknown function (DUF2442)